MKKIIHIVEAFGGGVFTYLVDLINNTIDDYDITIIYNIREQTPKNFKEYFDKRVKFIQIKNFTREINIKNDFKAFIEIEKKIKELKPDIVHLHSTKAGIIGRIATIGKKTNVIYNPHAFAFLMKDISKTKKAIYWGIEKITAMLKKSIIVGCSKGEYEAALKISNNSICINNGINVEKINLTKKDINLSKLNICTIGRIDKQKNPQEFNNIASELTQMNFTWIGDGELKNKLTSKNINVTGWKAREEVIKILNQQDIFVLTSLWEGLPISLLEAMYMKKICIVSNVTGNKDVIENNKNGFVANDNEYAQIIKQLTIEDIERITENAHKDVLEKYNFKENVKTYKKIYEEGKIYNIQK